MSTAISQFAMNVQLIPLPRIVEIEDFPSGRNANRESGSIHVLSLENSEHTRSFVDSLESYALTWTGFEKRENRWMKAQLRKKQI